VNIGLYLIVVFVIAVSVGLFEVWGINHYRIGWGEDLPENTVWGKKIHVNLKFRFGKIHVGVDRQLVTRYHAAMFFVIVPTAFVLLAKTFNGSAEHLPKTLFAWIFAVIAGFAGISGLEDFLFFVFSSLFGKPYPHALQRLFRGEATWHFGHFPLGKYRIPNNYWLSPLAATVCLIIAAMLN
jgi:hypothetical protein